MQKNWLITGVSSGLGRLLAEKALARGNRVVRIAELDGQRGISISADFTEELVGFADK